MQQRHTAHAVGPWLFTSPSCLEGCTASKKHPWDVRLSHIEAQKCIDALRPVPPVHMKHGGAADRWHSVGASGLGSCATAWAACLQLIGRQRLLEPDGGVRQDLHLGRAEGLCGEVARSAPHVLRTTATTCRPHQPRWRPRVHAPRLVSCDVDCIARQNR